MFVKPAIDWQRTGDAAALEARQDLFDIGIRSAVDAFTAAANTPVHVPRIVDAGQNVFCGVSNYAQERVLKCNDPSQRNSLPRERFSKVTKMVKDG
jgi:hypothetical protein